MSKSVKIATIVLLLALVVADVVATHALLTSRFPGANDFYSRWAGARAFWTQGLSPYSEEASTQIEMGIYGRRALPDEDPGPFAYPFYTVFVIAPLAFLPYEWAEAIWLALLEFALIGGVIGAMLLAGWRPRPALLAGTILWAILFYPSARAILLGQFAVVIFALTVAALLALRPRQATAPAPPGLPSPGNAAGFGNPAGAIGGSAAGLPSPAGADGSSAAGLGNPAGALGAGVLLALTTIKPQMAFLIVPLFLVWAGARRWWRVVIGFAAAMALLAGASFALEPAWLGDFVRQLLRYPSYTAIGSPVWVVTRYYLPALGAPGEIILSLALLAWMLATWVRAVRRPAWPVFLWTVGVTLVVTNLVALRTATTNYVILLIPLIHIFAAIQRRWGRAGAWAVAGIELALLVGLWALFFATVAGKFEHPIMYLPLPIGVAVALAGWRAALERSVPA